MPYASNSHWDSIDTLRNETFAGAYEDCSAVVCVEVAYMYMYMYMYMIVYLYTSGPTPQVASPAAHMYVCSSKLRDVV